MREKWLDGRKVNTTYYECIMFVLHKYPPEFIDSYTLFSTLLQYFVLLDY